MNGAFEIAGIGMESQQKALDVIANNIANINTPAFRRSEVRFSEIIAAASESDNPQSDLAALSAPAGVRTETLLALNEAGPIETTGHPLDVAIRGEGFIELMGPQGQTLLWRGGALTIGEDGALSAGGFALRDAIAVPDDTVELSIGRDGSVLARRNGEDEPSAIGAISLVRVDDPAMLERMDGGLYRPLDEGALVAVRPGEAGAGELIQGALERSNVDLNAEMVRLLIVQRAYAANAQILQAADQLTGIVNNLRR